MKYCEILNNKVNWIFTDEDTNPDLYADLDIHEITDRLTYEGQEIVEGDYYDSLYDIYFSQLQEYKNWTDLKLSKLEILVDINRDILNNNKNNAQEIVILQQQISDLNNKIDNLAQLILFLNGK